MRKVLAVVAHPDDEVLGIGGTLLKHKQQGDKVYICIATTTYSPQWSEEYRRKMSLAQLEVSNTLNTDGWYNLDFPAVKLNTIPDGEFNSKVTEVINEVKPDIVYTHFEGDLNQDHTKVFRAVLVATRPPKKIKVLCFETLSETEWNNKPFIPNLWVDISDFINKKLKLFSIYTPEIRSYPHPRSSEGIILLSQKRGMEISIPYAEAFMLIRGIE